MAPGSILRLALLIVTGMAFIYLSTKDSFLIFDAFLILGLLLIGFILFVAIVFKDAKMYKVSGSALSFLPTGIGSLIIAATLITADILEQPNNSTVLLHAGYDSGHGGYSLTFRSDSTYEFGNGGGMGGHTYKGKYRINDSIITLDKSTIDTVFKSSRLVIRPQKALRNADTVGTYLFQVDSIGKPINNLPYFVVYVDNRHH